MGLLIFCLIIIIIFFPSIGYFIFGPFAGKTPIKTKKRFKDIWGNRRTETIYHDTGKRVDTVNRDGFWGGRVKETYVTKRCFKCNSDVNIDSDGFYRCTCGKKFR